MYVRIYVYLYILTYVYNIKEEEKMKQKDDADSELLKAAFRSAGLEINFIDCKVDVDKDDEEADCLHKREEHGS